MIKIIKTFDKTVSKTPKLLHCQQIFSTFLALLKDTVCTKALSETTLIFRKYIVEKLGHLRKDTLFKYLLVYSYL